MGESKVDKHYFVVVHGACHGAWSWYKLKPLLEAAGHRVTAVDLAASGINMKSIKDVHSMLDYSQPLLELLASLDPEEKVVLVGHSLGGLNLAMAMENFPQKIAVAVFLTAFMPDTVNQPSYVLEQYCERVPPGAWLDTQFGSFETPKGSLSSIFFGPKFISNKLYQLTPKEDFELAMALARPSSQFIEDLSKVKKLTENSYGSVPRVFAICDQDLGIPLEFQQWMIQNGGVSDVMEIQGADHMPMFSKPKETCDVLVKIASKFA
ncbi:salicylic acid-binding protein 2-like [Humulus lupulus]|uniref:salicylic acid-binding protein 2-like n=1 Tax=Humulus lupulus TaxID=3486 RepID=UPI002B408DDD|nr:salicylic acid-binding protein 2-like [Humulus lupulus]